MVNSDITFNDIHCSAFGLEVTDTERPLLAEAKHTFQSVPHKSGDILIFDNSKKDIDVKVKFLLNPVAGKTFFDICRDIRTWLATQSRKKLIFDDDPGWYYKAVVVSSTTIERIAEYGEFTINFKCEPDMIEVV